MPVSKIKEKADQAKDTAEDAAEGVKDTASKSTGSLRDQTVGAFSTAAKDILGPAFSQMGEQAAARATEYAKEQGPKLIREQVLPQIMKQAGVDNPADLAKVGLGKAGGLLSDSGGITGIAGKLMSKIGGGGKKGVATGYGQGRRIMIQQDQYVPVNIEDVYRAWTTSEWPEYMHRVNTLDRQYGEEEGEEARYSIGIKGFWFKKNFTAQITECKPFKYIVWKTTQGNIKNTGRVSFIEVGEDLTLMVLNLDMAPSGLREKWVRGFRYHKRGVRSDFHRFAAWVQMRTADELEDIEGWLGTIEGGKIVQSHEEWLEENDEEPRGEEDDNTDDDQEDEIEDEADAEEEDEIEEEDDDEPEDEDEPDEEEEPEPEKPKIRTTRQRQRRARSKA